jgi:hypothetical protein
MVDKPSQVFRFLPIKHSSAENGEYVDFWWNAYLKNIQEETYHLAFLSFHMIYMTAVYFLLYKISKLYRGVYEKSLFHLSNDEERDYLLIDSAFSFVNMKEKAVFRFLKIAGADHAFIGEVSKFIDDRNNASHAKGLIYFKDDPSGLEQMAVEYVKALEKIQNLFINESKKVSDTWKISEMNNFDLQLFVENEIMKNYLTPAELKVISLKEVGRPKLQRIINKFIEEYFDEN